MAARFEIRTAKFGRWSDVQRRTLPTGNMPTRGDIHVSWGQVNTDEFQQLLEENEGSWLMEKQTNGKRPAQKSYCSWIAKDFPQEGTRDSGFFGLSFHVEPNHVQADSSGAVFNKVVARCFLCEKFSTNALVRCARGNTIFLGASFPQISPTRRSHVTAHPRGCAVPWADPAASCHWICRPDPPGRWREQRHATISRGCWLPSADASELLILSYSTFPYSAGTFCTVELSGPYWLP